MSAAPYCHTPNCPNRAIRIAGDDEVEILERATKRQLARAQGNRWICAYCVRYVENVLKTTDLRLEIMQGLCSFYAGRLVPRPSLLQVSGAVDVANGELYECRGDTRGMVPLNDFLRLLTEVPAAMGELLTTAGEDNQGWAPRYLNLQKVAHSDHCDTSSMNQLLSRVDDSGETADRVCWNCYARLCGLLSDEQKMEAVKLETKSRMEQGERVDGAAAAIVPSKQGRLVLFDDSLPKHRSTSPGKSRIASALRRPSTASPAAGVDSATSNMFRPAPSRTAIRIPGPKPTRSVSPPGAPHNPANVSATSTVSPAPVARGAPASWHKTSARRPASAAAVVTSVTAHTETDTGPRARSLSSRKEAGSSERGKVVKVKKKKKKKENKDKSATSKQEHAPRPVTAEPTVNPHWTPASSSTSSRVTTKVHSEPVKQAWADAEHVHGGSRVVSRGYKSLPQTHSTHELDAEVAALTANSPSPSPLLSGDGQSPTLERPSQLHGFSPTNTPTPQPQPAPWQIPRQSATASPRSVESENTFTTVSPSVELESQNVTTSPAELQPLPTHPQASAPNMAAPRPPSPAAAAHSHIPQHTTESPTGRKSPSLTSVRKLGSPDSAFASHNTLPTNGLQADASTVSSPIKPHPDTIPPDYTPTRRRSSVSLLQLSSSPTPSSSSGTVTLPFNTDVNAPSSTETRTSVPKLNLTRAVSSPLLRKTSSGLETVKEEAPEKTHGHLTPHSATADLDTANDTNAPERSPKGRGPPTRSTSDPNALSPPRAGDVSPAPSFHSAASQVLSAVSSLKAFQGTAEGDLPSGAIASDALDNALAESPGDPIEQPLDHIVSISYTKSKVVPKSACSKMPSTEIEAQKIQSGMMVRSSTKRGRKKETVTTGVICDTNGIPRGAAEDLASLPSHKTSSTSKDPGSLSIHPSLMPDAQGPVETKHAVEHVLTIRNAFARSMVSVGSSIWTTNKDGKIIIRNAMTGAVRHSFGVHVRDFDDPHKIVDEQVWCMILVNSSDIWIGTASGRVLVYSSETGRMIHDHGKRHRSGIICMHQLQQYVYTGSDDFTIGQWEAQDGTWVRRLVGHRKSIRCFSSFNLHLASGSDDGTVRVWDVTGVPRATVNTKGQGILTLCQVGNRIWCGGDDRSIRIIGRLTAEDNLLAVGTDGTLEKANGDSGEEDDQPKREPHRRNSVLSKLTSSGSTMYVSKKVAQHLAYVDDETGMQQWRMKVFKRMTCHKGRVVRLLHLGDKVFSSSSDKTIRVFEASSGDLLYTLNGAHNGYIIDACPVARGDRFLFWSASGDETLRMWSANGKFTFGSEKDNLVSADLLESRLKAVEKEHRMTKLHAAHEFARIQTTNDTISKRVQILDGQYKDAQANLRDLEKENAVLLGRLQSKEMLMKDMAEELETLRNFQKGQKDSMNHLSMEREQLHHTIGELEQKLETKQQELLQLQCDNVHLINKFEASQRQIRLQEQQLHISNKGQKDARDEISKLRDNITETTSERAQLQKKLETIEFVVRSRTSLVQEIWKILTAAEEGLKKPRVPNFTAKECSRSRSDALREVRERSWDIIRKYTTDVEKMHLGLSRHQFEDSSEVDRYARLGSSALGQLDRSQTSSQPRKGDFSNISGVNTTATEQNILAPGRKKAPGRITVELRQFKLDSEGDPLNLGFGGGFGAMASSGFEGATSRSISPIKGDRSFSPTKTAWG